MMRILITVAVSFLFLSGISAQNYAKWVEKKKFDKAEKYCEKQKPGDNTKCYLALGDECFNQNNFENALKYYTKATFKDGVYKVAEAYLRNNDIDKAYSAYDVYKYEKGVIKAGDAYFTNKNYDKAYECFSKYDYKDGMIKVADQYLADKNFEKAMTIYKKFNLKKKIIEVADGYFLNKDYEKAYEIYNTYYFDCKTKIIAIGDAYFDDKNIEKALEIYKKLKYRPGEIKIGNVFFKNKQYWAALDLFIRNEYEAGMLYVAKILFKEKNGIKVEIEGLFPNTDKLQPRTVVSNYTKKILSLAGINDFSKDTEPMILKVKYTCTAEKDDGYTKKNLYCSASVNGTIALFIQDTVVYKTTFKHSIVSSRRWGATFLEHGDSYQDPDDAPLESTIIEGIVPKLFLTIASISSDQTIKKALNSDNNAIRCAAVYTIGEYKFEEYIPQLIEILKKENWENDIQGVKVGVVYECLNALHKITNGSIWQQNEYFSSNHHGSKEYFFKWWGEYQTGKK
ncbi:MAG: hypothetical protein V2A54_16435 [Bacteroidota bacterium]